MKKNIFIIALILVTTTVFSQKKEKIKGSKTVTIEQKTVADFDAIEVLDNLEISLIKGDKNGVELEADDNLQGALSLVSTGSVLTLSLSNKIASYKKFNIRVTYTDAFKVITSRDEAKITALETIKLATLSCNSFDTSKLFLNVDSKIFSLSNSDKSKAELNLKTDQSTIVMSKNAELKALISSPTLKMDMYQKAEATLEGDIIDFQLRLDNNAEFVGKNLSSKNAIVLAEAYSKGSVFASTTFNLDASGDAAIELYGDPKIEIKRFSDEVVLSKKRLK